MNVNHSAAALPKYDTQAAQASAPVIQQTLVLDAADAFSKGAQTVAGGRAVMTIIRANRQTLKQELGIK